MIDDASNLSKDWRSAESYHNSLCRSWDLLRFMTYLKLQQTDFNEYDKGCGLWVKMSGLWKREEHV